jgi:prevent-host-death family protein
LSAVSNQQPASRPARDRSGTPGKDLREVGVRELKFHAPSVIRRVEQGQRVVVTRHRKPVALLIPFSEAHEFVATYAEEFVEMRMLAREEHATGGSVGEGAVRVSKGALAVIEAPGFPKAAARRVLRQIAIRSRKHSTRGSMYAVRGADRGVVVARAGHHHLICELLESRGTVLVAGAVHRSVLGRWIWSGGLPGYKVRVASIFGNGLLRSLEDMD